MFGFQEAAAAVKEHHAKLILAEAMKMSKEKKVVTAGRSRVQARENASTLNWTSQRLVKTQPDKFLRVASFKPGKS